MEDTDRDDTAPGFTAWLDEGIIFVGLIVIILAAGWTGYKLATAFGVCA